MDIQVNITVKPGSDTTMDHYSVRVGGIVLFAGYDRELPKEFRPFLSEAVHVHGLDAKRIAERIRG